MVRLTRNSTDQIQRLLGLAILLVSLIFDVALATTPGKSEAQVVSGPGPTISCKPPFITRPQPTLPKGFTEQILFSGCLNQPTALSFSADMTLAFVAEKGGKVWKCDLSASTCTQLADLSSEVCNDADRGLLGLAVDPLNAQNVYVLYTTPSPGVVCTGNVVAVTGGQLSRLSSANGTVTETKILPSSTASSQPWCFYYTSHSIGGLAFGSDNTTLYVSAGDGASFNTVDYGQLDTACGDGMNLPQGAFRSQQLNGQPYEDGVILAVTNLSAATPSIAVVSKGLRNPFRFAVNPVNHDLYIGNVGWNTWEAIDHLSNAGQNFGWPCFEGWDPGTGAAAPQPEYQNPANTGNTSYCANISASAPFFAYAHGSYVTPADSKAKTCGGRPSGGGPDQNGSVISAIGFTDDSSTTYPAIYKNALYFGDYLRRCIWMIQMPPPSNTSLPQPQAFAKGLQGGAVDLKGGPNGDLFYVDLVTSTIRRITHQ
ncbi:conserved exported hypothetical protein [Paraburkholderia piptadeniae]|uniref:Glucose/Sorbosone dehydrogenase domain-containing protein n=1 Tax=Paraburkholderia piptadeniae TaxID=1701573 RepID=A0A1N7STF5_9BURK|nr:PQQ-dependent sugar dehydrogenase [Paraburkholderia piptadeniae]SIT50227.1 conserved exported hypothetical protein [Paraburkholderia piptadeniae]